MSPPPGATPPDPALPPRLPRWFWLLPLCAVAAWWPIAPYWQSDDFLALHYARDFGNVLRDFAGPQYGATDVWLFYRPLITLSFWFDQLVAGADPFFAHLGNVLAHGASALLVALVWRRFLPDRTAFCAGLLWAMMPGHLGSIAWAVGRVDSHTTVWCLCAGWLFLRQLERTERAVRWPALLAAALALMSKESAFVLPPLLTALGFLRANGTFARRLWLATRQSAPVWLLFAGYLGLRFLALGRFGGYLGAQHDPMAMLTGLGLYVANTLVPLRWCGVAVVTDSTAAPLWALVLAAAPLALAVAFWLRRPRGLISAALLFTLACAPLAAFLAGAENVHNLRYLYLPSVALAGLLAAPGRLCTALVLFAWSLPFVAARGEQRDADRESASLHAAILREAEHGATSPMFVAGLPHANRSGTAVQLHFAVDRMLEPPFADGGTRLFALRPLAPSPGVFRLSPAGDPPWALPVGSTWYFDPSTTTIGEARPAPPLPDLPITGDVGGVLDLSSERLLALARGELTIRLITEAGQPQVFRLTIFTASGYLSCLFQDHGEAGAEHGTIDVLQLLGGDPERDPALLAARKPLHKALYGPSPLFNLGEGMVVPATIDLDTSFPVLLEAGAMRGLRFVPTHRARRLLRFRFDRDYAAWVRLVQGRG